MINYDNIRKSPTAFYNHQLILNIIIFSTSLVIIWTILVNWWCFTLRPRKDGRWGWRYWKSFHSLPTITPTPVGPR